MKTTMTILCGRLFMIAPLTLALVGCGGGEDDTRPRQPIAGTVTLDGQPVPEATIQFMPNDLNAGVPAFAEIKDGKFEIEREQGPVPGGYRVVISRADNPPWTPDGPEPGPRPRRRKTDLIPPQYNVKSTLVAVVKPDDPNVFDFSLVKKAIRN